MHFISETRYNPRTQCDDCYYRIKESFRDLAGRPRHRLMLTVGFIDEDLSPYDIRDIGRCLTWLHEHQGRQDLFGDAMSRYKEDVRRLALKYWDEMVKAGSVDAVRRTIEDSRAKAGRLVDVDTMEHTDAREVGAEWICLQAIRELGIDKFLEREGWSETRINTALAQLITRTVYSPSELKSLDTRVADYKSKTMMPDLEVMAKVYAENAKDISTAHLELSNMLYVVQSIRDYLRDESKKDELLPALLLTEKSGLQEEVSRYNELMIKRNRLIANSSKESPLVKDLDKQLSDMHDAVLVSANNAIKQFQLQLKSVIAKENEGKQLLASAPQKAIGGLSDERDWKVLNQIYVFLLQKREEAQMAKALKTDVRVLTPPLGVKKQTSPVMSTILLGALLFGLFIPACTIFVRERNKR